MDESEVVAGIRRGDAAAKKALFDSEAERVWSLVYRLTGDYDSAQDVTQETFISAFRKIDSFTGSGSLGGWIGRIAINLARDSMRKEKRHQMRIVSIETVENQLATVENDTDQSIDPELDRAVNDLAPEYRTVLLMHDLEGFSHEEIGTALGIATGSSRARLSRARSMMREALTGMERLK